jgi:hypothetical protein
MPRTDSARQDCLTPLTAGFSKLGPVPELPPGDCGDAAETPTIWEAGWIDLGGEG